MVVYPNKLRIRQISYFETVGYTDVINLSVNPPRWTTTEQVMNFPKTMRIFLKRWQSCEREHEPKELFQGKGLGLEVLT